MRLEPVFNENQKLLWRLSYRMTGSAADAEDVLQETFVRLISASATAAGEFFAARVPVVGRTKVASMLSKLMKGATEFQSETRTVDLNGLFAVATERSNAPEGYAKRLATLFKVSTRL